MRTAGCMLAALMLPAFAACKGQDIANQKPVLPEPTALPRSVHSSKADMAVPMCSVPFIDSPGANGVGKGVTPPRIVHSVEAQLSDEARGLNGAMGSLAFLSLIVDASGIPQDLCLIKSAGYGLDANAANAVRQYKFDPAIKDGKPVPTRITIEVDFRKYPKTPVSWGTG
jgi:TonB family protein